MEYLNKKTWDTSGVALEVTARENWRETSETIPEVIRKGTLWMNIFKKTERIADKGTGGTHEEMPA